VLQSPDMDTRMRGSGGGACTARMGRKRGEKGRVAAMGETLYNGTAEGAREGDRTLRRGRKGVGSWPGTGWGGAVSRQWPNRGGKGWVAQVRTASAE
jgi:hypothetical protein